MFIWPTKTPGCAGSCVLWSFGTLFSLICSANKTACFVSSSAFLPHAERGGRKMTKIFSCNKRLRVNLDQPFGSI